MPSVNQVIAMRRVRRTRLQRSPKGRIGFSASLLISLPASVLAILIPLGYILLSYNLPSPQILPALLEPPYGLLRQPTQITDRSGEHVIASLENPGARWSRYLSLEGESTGILPSSLISATLAVSDPSFWSHSGATWTSLRLWGKPTLAQRLSNDILFSEEPPGITRSLREQISAMQITARFGREKVLEWYLNSASYGSLAYGADAAARAYFGKTASQLTLGEAAVLAAASENPADNPWDAPEAAIEGQHLVIAAMLDRKFITLEQAVAARQEKIVVRDRPVAEEDANQAFVNLVLSQIGEKVSRERLERGGLKIITTLDYDLQQQAVCTAQLQLERLETSNATLPASATCPAGNLLPTLTRQAARLSGIEANLTVLDPLTGEVLALAVISPESSRSGALAPHPAGTILTPFVYLTGFASGLSPSSLTWDMPSKTEVSLPAGAFQNLDGQFHGPVRLRTALANDYWLPVLTILEQAGAENVWRTARQMGLISLEYSGKRDTGYLPLVEGKISILEASRSYAILANQGMLAGEEGSALPGGDILSHLRSKLVLGIDDAHGTLWTDWPGSQTQSITSSQLAYLVTHVLSDEPARWPSLGHPNSLETGRPAAAKIGRTQGANDAWTIGYTPQRVVGVWVGLPASPFEGQNKGNEQDLLAGSEAIWHAVLQYASRDLPIQSWNIPSGIDSQAVCDPSGMLPSRYCPSVVDEVFIAGTEPTHTDDLFRPVQVNRETGNLVTIFTPPELVEERVYLFPPPEGQEWVQISGVDIPPKDYDPVEIPAASPQVSIVSPEMYAYINGEVDIRGSAGGESFSFYRLQVGKGLNPQQWLQVGEDISRPVDNGVLAVWDTRGLSGLYVVELLIVHEDQSIERTHQLVTVDNQPPEVSIVYPLSAEANKPHPSGTITIQVDAEDDTVLDRVEIYIDDRLLAAIPGPPYAYPWAAKPGEYRIRVKAWDRAGNTSQDSVTVEVVK